MKTFYSEKKKTYDKRRRFTWKKNNDVHHKSPNGDVLQGKKNMINEDVLQGKKK